MESPRARKAIIIDSFVGKTLLIEREWVDGRITVVLVCELTGI
jgi:hypothetical protein